MVAVFRNKTKPFMSYIMAKRNNHKINFTYLISRYIFDINSVGKKITYNCMKLAYLSIKSGCWKRIAMSNWKKALLRFNLVRIYIFKCRWSTKYILT